MSISCLVIYRFKIKLPTKNGIFINGHKKDKKKKIRGEKSDTHYDLTNVSLKNLIFSLIISFLKRELWLDLDKETTICVLLLHHVIRKCIFVKNLQKLDVCGFRFNMMIKV